MTEPAPVSRAGTEMWSVPEEEYPADGSASEKLAFCVRYAILAPSSHNSQPWLFRRHGDALELLADRSRALPVVDPEDRELVISCGAALFHLRVALRHFGHEGRVTTLDPPRDYDALALRTVPEHLATVALGEPRSPTEAEERLFEAIPRRRTNRRPFEARPLPAALLDDLQEADAEEGAWLAVLEREEARAALADLVAEADREQGADPRFRRELAAWVNPNRSRSRDGMPGYAFGMGDLASYVGPLVVRTFDWGEGQAAKDRQLAEGSPALAILGTRGDHPYAWLNAGQALDRVVLRAASEGVSASYLNQPIELSDLRPRVTQIAGRDGFAQIVLRLGYGPDVPPTPRRPLEDVLI